MQWRQLMNLFRAIFKSRDRPRMPGRAVQRQRNDQPKNHIGDSSNAHKVAVLEEGMKFNPISINPHEAQFLETRKFQVNEICRIFRVPPHMIADLDKSSFETDDQEGDDNSG